mmetsp:Transcript_83149/g.161817  ORF Transcript_83149/g.161817 Transcript_83149/m.161817 type:complete len:132 (+) Transcript_83149:259-654(+)
MVDTDKFVICLDSTFCPALVPRNASLSMEGTAETMLGRGASIIEDALLLFDFSGPFTRVRNLTADDDGGPTHSSPNKTSVPRSAEIVQSKDLIGSDDPKLDVIDGRLVGRAALNPHHTDTSPTSKGLSISH